MEVDLDSCSRVLVEKGRVLPYFLGLLSMPISALKETALAGVAQWIECWPTNQKVGSSIPGEDTRLG